jgi:hypothetical protein
MLQPPGGPSPSPGEAAALRAMVQELLPGLVRDTLNQMLQEGLENRLRQYIRELLAHELGRSRTG